MKSVGFDFDGVIADSRSAAWNAAERILNPFGISTSITTPKAMETAFGHAAQNALVGPEHAAVLRMMHRLLMRHRAHDLVLLEDVITLVAELEAPRILVTAALAEGVVTRLGSAARLFDEVVGFESGRKPDLLAARANQFCVYITDTVSDVEICKALALPVIACTWASHDDLEMLAAARPDAIVNNTIDLASILNKFIHQQGK